MAASKEAVVICLDVGPSMELSDDEARDRTRLDQALQCVTMILQRKIFTESKDEIALVLFGSRDTDNQLASGDQYQHIRVVRSLQMPDWDIVKFVENSIESSDQHGDFIDALVVCLDLLMRETEGKKFGFQSIVLISDLGGPFVDDSVDQVIASLKKFDIDLTFVGPDLLDSLTHALDDDDNNDGGSSSSHVGGMMNGNNGAGNSSNSRGGRPPTGSSQEPGPSVKRSESDLNQAAQGRREQLRGKMKSKWQRRAEKMMAHILRRCDAVAYSFQRAQETVAYFQRKSVRPSPWYCNLSLGPEVIVPVAAYKKLEEYKPKQSWKRCYAAQIDAELINERTYHLNDDEQTQVEKDDIVKAYRYGTTLVPFDQLDQDNMKYKCEKQLSVISFYPINQIKRNLFTGNSSWILISDPREKDPSKPAASALTALVVAAKDQRKVAVARYVFRAGTQPKLMLLLPVVKLADPDRMEIDVKSWANELIEGNVKKAHFVMIQLPFMEDVRDFIFPHLDSELTAAEKEALNELIDARDLANYVADAQKPELDATGVEIVRPERVPNPYIQRLCHCLQQRVLNPDEPLPELPLILMENLDAPEELELRAEPAVHRLKELFKLKENEKKTLQKQGLAAADVMKEEEEDPSAKQPRLDLGGDGEFNLANVTSGLNRNSVDRIGTVKPGEDFLAMILSGSEELVNLAFATLPDLIRQLVFESFKHLNYAKSIGALKTFREQCIKQSRPVAFNDFMIAFKPELPTKNRRDFWDQIVKEAISLITSAECSADGSNSTTAEDATGFLSVDSAPVTAKPPTPPPVDDDDDLLDMIE